MPKSKIDLTLTAVLERDPHSGFYTAEAVELPGCISEGRIISEALAGIKEAAELFLSDLPEKSLLDFELARPRFQPKMVVRKLTLTA